MITEEAIARIGSWELYFDVTLLVALAGVVWTVVSRLAQAAFFVLSLRTREIEIDLKAKAEIPDEIAGLHLLFIRYGNDLYLRDLASDREKYHGRLRNKVKQIRIDRETLGERPIKVPLRVHKRLGSQFKLFVEVNGDPSPVVDYLESHDMISGVGVARRPFRGKHDTGRSRVWFLLDQIDKVETVDGMTNNFVFPV
ncbi:hypothetical protein ABMC89_01030 [Sulfitobacter sp. HNIBRBA3233]|uniref:hypothetical protein n=1 Tax=Sulfitobacter marinivivus TaxID=3158558 RepID=UPI0032DF9755